jgi:hypothetical protein
MLLSLLISKHNATVRTRPRLSSDAARIVVIPGGATAFGRAAVGRFTDFFEHVNQLDVDSMAGIASAGHHHGAPTARILLGNGGDPDAFRFLHEQILMDIAPQSAEGNENIDGTRICTIRTPLARWMEESVVLDGPYVHDTVMAMKSKLTEPLEKQYESDMQVILAKKAKDEEEKKRRMEEKVRQDSERAQATSTASTTTAIATEPVEQSVADVTSTNTAATAAINTLRTTSTCE